jgi:hypothetical protein
VDDRHAAVLGGQAFSPGAYRIEIRPCPFVFRDRSPAESYAALSDPPVTDSFIKGPPGVPGGAESQERITVLFIAAGPDDQDRLRLDREFRRIQERIRASQYRDRLGVEIRPAAQVVDLLQMLNETRPHIVHFSGHGSSSGLAFEDAEGNTKQLSNADLGMLLKASSDRTRLTVFNSCESADQAITATQHVDAAIGMDQPIDDDAAKVFAGQLYSALGFGKSPSAGV